MVEARVTKQTAQVAHVSDDSEARVTKQAAQVAHVSSTAKARVTKQAVQVAYPTPDPIVVLAGSAPAVGYVAGDIHTSVRLAGCVVATAQTRGSLVEIGLGGVVPIVNAATASLALGISLSGTAASAAEATANLSVVSSGFVGWGIPL